MGNLETGKSGREVANKRAKMVLYHEFASISPVPIAGRNRESIMSPSKQDISDQLNVAAELEAYRSHLEKLV